MLKSKITHGFINWQSMLKKPKAPNPASVSNIQAILQVTALCGNIIISPPKQVTLADVESVDSNQEGGCQRRILFQVSHLTINCNNPLQWKAEAQVQCMLNQWSSSADHKLFEC